jgi:hypothetical protein
MAGIRLQKPFRAAAEAAAAPAKSLLLYKGKQAENRLQGPALAADKTSRCARRRAASAAYLFPARSFTQHAAVFPLCPAVPLLQPNRTQSFHFILHFYRPSCFQKQCFLYTQKPLFSG